MNRQVHEMAPPGKKTSLWTPWGSQRVPDPDKAVDKARRRPGRRAEEGERDRFPDEWPEPDAG